MAGYAAYGTRFERGDGGDPEEFQLVGEAVDIDGPEQDRDTIEVTSHDSPNRFREFVGGLIDGGEVSFEVRYDPELHNPLQDDFEDPMPRSYRIVLPQDLGIWNMQAFVTNMGMSFPLEDAMSCEFTFKISGKPTFEEAS